MRGAKESIENTRGSCHKLSTNKRKNIHRYDQIQLKVDFISNIFHELKTPLNVILGTIQLLNRCCDLGNISNEDLKKYMNIMEQNCYRMIRLVNNLLDINKINAGYYKLRLGNYDIVNIVKSITYSVVDYIESKKIELVFNTSLKSKIIACDPDKMERIILNLLSNAVKFTNPGGKITVCLYENKERVIISIKDTGIGIPEDKLTSIFERYNQIEGINREDNEGTGIGLALVKSLVEMHNGNIRANSKVGVGTEFIIELPSITINVDDYTRMKDIDIKHNRIEKINIEFSDIYK